jgi:hypothetical protein
MVRPVVGGASIGAAKSHGVSHGVGRADLAMSVLQYGTAIVAIVVVTLLATVR